MVEGPCTTVCAKNSNLCNICLKREEKYILGINTTKWHGRIGGPIAPESHIVGSQWNETNRAKTAKTAKKNTTRRKRSSSGSGSGSRRRNTVTGPIIYKPVTHYSERWSRA